MKKKETRGKPPRYEGEKSTRLSVLIRPRYRQALELIAKDRESTLSEAMELAIATLSRSYIIENRPALYYFSCGNEIFDSITSCIKHIPKGEETSKNENFQILAKKEMVKFITSLSERSALPSIVKSPFEQYCIDILMKTASYIYLYFDLDDLTNKVFDEAWRIGLTPNEVALLIEEALKKQGVLEPFSKFIGGPYKEPKS